MLFTVAEKPVHMYVDCLNTVSALNGYKQHAAGPNAPRAHHFGTDLHRLGAG